MASRVAAANPSLLAIKGIGSVLATQLLITAGDNPDRLRSSSSFAALCGTAPIPVSSGRTDRHRLSRGGDRAANCALHQIVKVRMITDPRTRTYRNKHLAKGWTNKAVYRSLKRAIVREIYRALIGRYEVPDHLDLAPPAKPRTSPWPRPPATSTSGPPRCPTSSSANAETTTSPTPTATGSPPLDRP